MNLKKNKTFFNFAVSLNVYCNIALQWTLTLTIGNTLAIDLNAFTTDFKTTQPNG